MSIKIKIDKTVSLFTFGDYLATQKLPDNSALLIYTSKFKKLQKKLWSTSAYHQYLSIIKKYTNRNKKIKTVYLDVLFGQKAKSVKQLTKSYLTKDEYQTFWSIHFLLYKEYFALFWAKNQQKITTLTQLARRFSLNNEIVSELQCFFKIPKVDLKNTTVWLVPWPIKNNFFGRVLEPNLIVIAFPLNKRVGQKSWATFERVLYHELIHAKFISAHFYTLVNQLYNVPIS